MKKIVSFLFIASMHSAIAQNFKFSGGYSTSTLVCEDGQVYTWGSNLNEAGSFGILGNNSTKIIEPSPLKVTFPAGIKIKSVDAGSGAHFLAIDTDDNIWAWGDNTGGQIGQGNTASLVISTPKRVLKGITTSINAYLTGVNYISSGNNSSFAILKNKRVVSWGNNTYGQLGNNSTLPSSTPVYVLDSLQKPLENAIQVEAGDVATYALIDADGDGIGTVYSWGGGKTPWNTSACLLGRSAKGGTNNGREIDNDSLAKPVVLKNGTRLNNIVAISAGDVFCMALDKDGFVWTWGQNGWGGLCGQGNTEFNNFSDPRKVVGGLTKLPFLKAKKISGAQGFAMAITLDNKPVAWGNNSLTTSGTYAGGVLGIGSSTYSSSIPVYVRFGVDSNSVHNNVETISDGDVCGFYTTTDKKMYVWGGNRFGQLGLGHTLDQFYAKPLNVKLLSCNSESIITTNENTELLNESLIKIYPNPANDILNINISKPNIDYGIKIVDTMGKTVFTSTMTTNNLTVNLSQFCIKGLYIIQIFDNQNKVLDARKLLLE